MALTVAAPIAAVPRTSLSFSSSTFVSEPAPLYETSRNLTVLVRGRRRWRRSGSTSTRSNVVMAQADSPRAMAASTAMATPLKEEQRLKAPSSFEYNRVMKEQMRTPYTYQHELGICFTRITRHVIVGSQPQTPQDVSMLRSEEGVDVILNLQEDKDAAYWGVDLGAIERRCQEEGVAYHRRPARDFDPNSLRRNLPRMVAVIAKSVAEGKTVYVHCTAGLGRSPAAVIAYLFWMSEPKMNLQKAYDLVTSLRPCGPKWEAIRGATYDMAKNSPYQPALESLPSFAFSDIAGWERDLIQDRIWHSVI